MLAYAPDIDASMAQASNPGYTGARPPTRWTVWNQQPLCSELGVGAYQGFLVRPSALRGFTKSMPPCKDRDVMAIVESRRILLLLEGFWPRPTVSSAGMRSPPSPPPPLSPPSLRLSSVQIQTSRALICNAPHS